MDIPISEPIWHTKYAAAYLEDGKMTIRYRFPYSRQREASLLGAHHLLPNDRYAYYETLSAMIERHFAISRYLEAEGVPSIITYENAYQKQTDDGIIYICGVLSEPVTPITQALLSSDCNALTVLDIFLRLAHILRDISKTPISPVLRYLDMDDVYLTSQNKILLGGFFYAAGEELTPPPAYLPDSAQIIPSTIRNGTIGNIGTDMQILAQIAWNLFSGLPWDSAHTPQSRQIPPQYAPPELLRVLETGLEGDPKNFNSFRKQLLQCRKELAKTDFAQTVIPMRLPLRKEYAFCTEQLMIPAAEEENR